MHATKIEPGLLPAFRWYAGLRLAIALGLLALRGLGIEPPQIRLLYPGLLEAIFLLCYLSWPWLAAHTGRAYLPLALMVASAAPILNQAANIRLRLAMGLPPNQATSDGILWALALVAPLVLVAWQYDMTGVVAFCLGTATLEAGILLAMAARPVAFPAAWSLIVVRSLIYLLAGYLVARLMRGQRAQRAALAQANAQLARLAATAEQLAVARERNRLARELHDTLAHSLSAVAVQLEGARAQWDENPVAARDLQTKALATTRQGLVEARRAIQSLRARPLDDLGLCLALQTLAETTAERAGLALNLDLPERLPGLDASVEQGVYRIAGEAMTNAAQHAGARRLELALRRDGAHLTLTVADDGRGFEPTLAAANGHFGLVGMAEHSRLIGGHLHIDSRPGRGTVVRLSVEVGP
jgi:signal transduction histidine kinase